MSILQTSLTRMKSGAYNQYNLANLDEWLTKFTRLNGKPYSFKDREFQVDIIRDPSKTQIVMKPAQTGLSELSYRFAVAACCCMDNFACIYTFPTATDAQNNNRTRINPMIADSEELKRLVDPELNNSEIKKFGKNSFLYFKGTVAETNALSTPADMVIHDEVDKSDPDVLTTYVSRLQDKPTKMRRLFSTPTIANFGIHKETLTATRKFHFVKCESCNHWFLPDYFNDVRVPGWDKPLDEITKQNLHLIRYEEAWLCCPNCGLDPNIDHTRMQWVTENPDENHHATAWMVSPFSAHRRILLKNLVKNSTEYRKFSEFKNQALGIVAEEETEAITETDIDNLQSLPLTPDANICQMGVDMGVTCTITVGRELETGELAVFHRERCRYTDLLERMQILKIQYNVSVQVVDSGPLFELVTQICNLSPNAWGANYVQKQDPVLFTVREEKQVPEEGKLGFQAVNVNRTAAFDTLLEMIKRKQVLVSSSEENAIFKKHMLCMKRVAKFTRHGELTHVWVKTGDEEDHYHHSLLYLMVATKLRHTASGVGFAAAGMLPLYLMKGKRIKNPENRLNPRIPGLR